MATINFTETINESLDFAKSKLGKSWKEFKVFGDHHFKQLAENAEFL